MAVMDSVRQRFPTRARTPRLGSCLLLVLVLTCPCPGRAGAQPTPSGFETPPLEPGSIQWDINRRSATENQERYRTRVAIPYAFGDHVPKAATASLVNGPMILTSPPAAQASSAIVWQMFCGAAVFVLTGLLALRKWAPQVLVELNQLYNPWALAPAATTPPSARVRAEEEAFGEFLKVFRIGPAAPAGSDQPRKAGRLKEFYAQAKERRAALRKLLQDIGRDTSDQIRLEMLKKLHFELGRLKDEAGLPETLPVWQAASALEGLLKQLIEKVRNATPSTLRTVAGALDLLDDLCVPGLPPDLLTAPAFKFLVVDDDLISCQALSLSLKKAFSQPDLAGNGEMALAYAAAQPYDVIFLDVQMPGMDGFELCTKIRETAANRTTPVVFVTIQSDFDARCRSTLSGGSDLMGKPFLTFEITVKALTLALHGRLRAQPRKPLRKRAAERDLAGSLGLAMDVSRPVVVPAIAPRPSFSRPPRKPDKITKAFLRRTSMQLGPLRELCQAMRQADDDATRQGLVVDGFLRLNSLIPKPPPPVIHPAYQLCAALEGLFRKLLQNYNHVTPSALTTAANAVELLDELCLPGMKLDLSVNPPIDMLVVDDDLVARRVMASALQTAFRKPESVDNGEAALALARVRPFDVIFLDVLMPGMDGFEVCSKIRETAANRGTPVVFVTGQCDFEARAEMSRNGGNDLMVKPFLTAEITVKALTFALRGRLQQLQIPPVARTRRRRKTPEARKGLSE